MLNLPYKTPALNTQFHSILIISDLLRTGLTVFNCYVSSLLTAEVGDFPIEEYADHTYLRANDLQYLPVQTEELEKKIMEYHKQHV